MKSKLLLFVFVLWSGAISAQIYHHQDTVKSLVITEYRGDNTHQTYLELTNMGDEPIQLGQFKIGWWGGDKLDLNTWKTDANNKDRWIPLDTLLPPGEAYVFAPVEKEDARKFAMGLTNVSEKQTQDKMIEYADYHVAIDTIDQDIGLAHPFSKQWGPGMNGFYIEQHLAVSSGDTVAHDSFLIDQVGGMFIGPDGVNLNRTEGVGYDVAGVTEATATAYLIRKHNVKTGTLDFNSARGIGLEDSEWIPIPHHGSAWRDPMWTVGNHGDYNLDANTLESDVIDVDFANKTLTVPWGVRRGDDIMSYFEQKPGIGWEYVMSAEADSLTHACQTGDQLLIYVCGDDLDFATFDIVVEDPAADANMVVPVANTLPETVDEAENYEIETGYWGWPRVTKHASGNDTIWGARGGIPFATRADTLLLDRLEKPSNAEWEIVYASEIPKPDLSDGDILKVTAQDGSVKEYYISMNAYRESLDATLSSITWPDIPEFYRGLFGWTGDTIPGFSTQVFNYNIQVPLIADGIPALVAKTSDTNAKLEVDRATSLSGDAESRTVNFTVTAEDDTTVNMYSVSLTKEKDPNNQQPYFAEPFISEVINNVYWTNDGYVEIVNPGNQPLDLSNYMIIMQTEPNPAVAIAETNEGEWLSRYDKYIPGYKWGSEADWSVEQYIAQLDLSVNSQVQPGDVFVLGATPNVHNAVCNNLDYNWPVLTQVDVQFASATSDCYTIENQWGEEVGNRATPANKFRNAHIFLFKILNDSVQQGSKPATDPNDFQLLDVFGMGESSIWEIDGVNTNPTPDFRRKPGIYEGNTVAGESMGVNSPEDVEWDWWNHQTWAQNGFGWPDRMFNLYQDLGKHFMYAPTQYMSTVGSVVYKVSEGYESPQQIKGITTGTVVADFLNNVIKADSLQSLTLNSTADGSVLLPADLLSLNDTLTVLSADSTNVTKYVLDVTEEGLSSNAVLTSDRYDIEITNQPAAVGENQSAADGHLGAGTISGFEYGTTLQTVVNNVTVPSGASMSVINGSDAYVPLQILNFDSVYVETTVNADTYFEVVAENGTTMITYQLVPQATESDAFVTSDVYSVKEKDLLIDFVPRGSAVRGFLSNVIPSLGASIKVVDKWGFERTFGPMGDDDKLIVTSADGTVTKAYYISWLPTEDTQQTVFTAYVLSNVYDVDQVDYKIYGASGTADISQFFSRIEPSAGATAVVVDEDGNEKTSGSLTGTDKVKVTSADGDIVVMYTFGQLTSSELFEANQIEMYPNPFNGRLNVTGVEKGQRIQVYNAAGSVVKHVDVQSNHELIELNDHPAGLYLIVISDENRLIGRYKAIKK